ncbi:MAG: DNA mismatch repair endonuclease MutL [Bacteroidota bacterium]
MPDVIQLLPDAVANQIAAGEVIQRPASVVKELLENAVDAGASEIKLIVKDAGKTLIRVTDNGCGMSETDARMSLERHATSKIRQANDLFAIRTLGFRGEALASIAAVAQFEVKTKRTEDELGTHIAVEGSKVTTQEACQAANGTSISVKNLFFNIPARRKFLKSNPVETRHIIDEFQRVALAYPGIHLSLFHNDQELFHLPKGSIRQRIVNIFGKHYNQRLVPVEEQTNIIGISGFIGKPDAARKTRGEQFFFVNNRFIKSNYHHHAVQAAFQELIPKGHHPSYFLFLEADPEAIDINIHPTKTEVKFEDEKAVYAIIRSVVQRSLGQYNIAPSIDFEQETSFDIPYAKHKDAPVAPTIEVDPEFNPFKTTSPGTSAGTAPRESALQRSNRENWESLYQDTPTPEAPRQEQVIQANWDEQPAAETKGSFAHQLYGTYILTKIKSGLLVVHQQRAHERILYERYRKALEARKGASQQLMFPLNVELPAADAELLKELMELINAMGFDLREFGQHAFVVHGVPADLPDSAPEALLEGILENFKGHRDLKLETRENLARSLARSAAVKVGATLQPEEMNTMIDALFACEMPYVSPTSLPTIITLSQEDLEARFKRL